MCEYMAVMLTLDSGKLSTIEKEDIHPSLRAHSCEKEESTEGERLW